MVEHYFIEIKTYSLGWHSRKFAGTFLPEKKYINGNSQEGHGDVKFISGKKNVFYTMKSIFFFFFDNKEINYFNHDILKYNL